MNVGLQKERLKKVMEKNFRERNLPQENIDEILESAWEDHIDDELELPENITQFYKLGILKEVIPYSISDKDYYGEVKHKLIETITQPYYHCQFDECDFQTMFKEGMIEHFQEEHGLDDSRIPPKNPHDMTYIILDELLQIALSKEYRNKKNFKVSNEHLWEEILSRLKYKKDDKSAPSNQVPRRTLEDLGLLGRNKQEMKNKIGYDKNSRRIYRINKKELEDAILESKFYDLVFKIAP